MQQQKCQYKGDANKNQRDLAGNVGIREEVCLNDANIGLEFPRYQVKKGGKRWGCRTTRLKNLVVWQLFFQKKGKNSAPAEFF